MFLNSSHESLSSATEEKDNSIKKEVIRLLLIFSVLAIFISLISYQPNDPTLSSLNPKIHPHNWMGRFGSLLSWVVFQIFGFSGFALCFVALLYLFKKGVFSEDLNPHDLHS